MRTPKPSKIWILTVTAVWAQAIALAMAAPDAAPIPTGRPSAPPVSQTPEGNPAAAPAPAGQAPAAAAPAAQAPVAPAPVASNPAPASPAGAAQNRPGPGVTSPKVSFATREFEQIAAENPAMVPFLIRFEVAMQLMARNLLNMYRAQAAGGEAVAPTTPTAPAAGPADAKRGKFAPRAGSSLPNVYSMVTMPTGQVQHPTFGNPDEAAANGLSNLAAPAAPLVQDPSLAFNGAFNGSGDAKGRALAATETVDPISLQFQVPTAAPGDAAAGSPSAAPAAPAAPAAAAQGGSGA